MQILTLENKTFYLNELPDEIDNDLRFAVFDNSDNNNPDYFYIPLINIFTVIKHKYFLNFKF